MAWCDVVDPRTLRECRIALDQSQSAFAGMLGVSPESYRTWDAGRRATPPKMLARERATVLTPLYVKTAAQEASLSCWRVRKSLMTR